MNAFREPVPHEVMKAPKRQRRQLAAEAGHLKEREISDVDVRGVLAAGNMQQANCQECERWLKSTLKNCWMLERAYATNQTKGAKIKRLGQVKKDLDRTRLGIVEDPWVLRQLVGARFLALSKKKHNERRLTLIECGAEKWGRQIAREMTRIAKTLSFAIKLLERRPDNGDEIAAGVSRAEKKALKHLTEMIVVYWEKQLRRKVDTGSKSSCVGFATAVYRAAGDAGASVSTSTERLKALLQAR